MQLIKQTPWQEEILNPPLTVLHPGFTFFTFTHTSKWFASGCIKGGTYAHVGQQLLPTHEDAFKMHYSRQLKTTLYIEKAKAKTNAHLLL